MKSWVKASILGLSCVVAIGLVARAQLNSSNSSDLAPATPPDTVVSAVASEMGLTLVPADQVPILGTFWTFIPGQGTPPPYPMLMDPTLPVYQISDGEFLVDATGIVPASSPNRMPAQMASASAIADRVTADANGMIKLVTWLQGVAEAQSLRMLGQAFGMDDGGDFLPPGAGDGGGGYGGFSGATPIDTNGLWLEITNVASGWSYLNLHHGTNQVYALLTTTNAATPMTNWNVELELFPSGDQTNVLPFAVQNLDRQQLFVRVEDWTGVDSNGDGVPDWWMWKYFGTLSLNATNFDSTGLRTLGDDFNNGVDPNVIVFTLESANDFINSTIANLQLNITEGTPDFYAVLVNGQTSTNWLPFVATNLTVVLGSTDGVYSVNVGLKGFPADATETWEQYNFTLDRVAPVLTITNPIIASGSATVIKPYLQLQGCADKPLATLSYDINNAFGPATNQNAFVIDQTFDTNKFDFTTNQFQAYDVPLATNDNFITVRVTDRAGNTTTTNFDVVLDYTGATNPPAVSLIWPQDGMAVSGTNITIRGTMSDETGTILALVVNGDGTTNTISGLVERNNMFWIENVPLNGTNQIMLQATDAAGNITTNNLTLYPSDLIVTIDSTPTGDDLYKPSGSVSGTVSDPSATVTVNGTNATVDDSGNWVANNVPIIGRGTATFDVQAFLPSQDSLSGQSMRGKLQAMNSSSSSTAPNNASIAVEMDSMVKVVEYHDHQEDQIYQWGGVLTDWHWTKDYSAQYRQGENTPISYDETADEYLLDEWNFQGENWYHWSDSDPGSHYSEDWQGIFYFGLPIQTDENFYGGKLHSVPDVDYTGSVGAMDTSMTQYYAKNVPPYEWLPPIAAEKEKLTISAETQVKLYTGGKAGIKRENLFCINAWARAFQKPTHDLWAYHAWIHTPAVDVAKNDLLVMGKKPGADGNLWIALPDNAEPYITVTAPGKHHYDAWATAGKYKLQIAVNNTYPLWPDHVPSYNNYCVGQYLSFAPKWSPPLPETPQESLILWAFDGTFVNKKWTQDPVSFPEASVNYTNDPARLKIEPTHAWWVSGGSDENTPAINNATLGMGLTFQNGQYVAIATHGKFNMWRPKAEIKQRDIFGKPDIYWRENWNFYIFDYHGKIGVGYPELPIKNYMAYETVIKSPQFSGNVKYTQIASLTNSGTVFDYSEVLDNQDPYNGEKGVLAGGSANFIDFDDKPDAPGYGSVKLHDSFTDYVMFLPDGSGDNIYVPLGKIFWHAFGEATYPSTTISPNEVSSPTDPDGSMDWLFWLTVFHNGLQ